MEETKAQEGVNNSAVNGGEIVAKSEVSDKGSNVNSVREFSWETAAFEKDVRDRVQWLGSKFSSIRIPPFVHKQLTSMKSYALENPFSAVLFLTLGIACSLPIAIFLGFAVATILFSFLGFLFVEGTLLTVATILFGSVVLFLGLLTLGLLLVGSVGYFTTSQLYSLCTGGSRPKFSTLLEKIPFLGDLFKPTTASVYKTKAQQNQNGYNKISNGHGPVIHELQDSTEEEEEEDSEITMEDLEDEGNVEILTEEEEDQENQTESETSKKFENSEVIEECQKDSVILPQEVEIVEVKENSEKLQEEEVSAQIED